MLRFSKAWLVGSGLHRLSIQLCICLFFGYFPLVQAEENDADCSSSNPGCIAVGEWDVTIGLGLGLRSNPLEDGDDIPLFILPEVRYYGKRFFLDTYTGGFTFLDSGSHMLNGVVTIGFDQIYFKSYSIGNIAIESGPFSAKSESNFDIDAYVADAVSESHSPDAPLSDSDNSDALVELELEQLRPRKTAGLAGLEYGYYNRHWDVSLQLLQDFTNVHKGQEVRAGVSRFVDIKKENIELAGGFSWQSAGLLRHYYGIEDSEVEDTQLVYTPEAGFSPFVRVDWRRKIIANWSWQATVHYRWLSSEIRNSPLVGENSVLTFYMGGVYHF
ncbi:outer membrane protein [Alteromonadaceae bacterium Bs31]|nr:outer membrane protein [Alteromonadaceae bacterium Bs31]